MRGLASEIFYSAITELRMAALPFTQKLKNMSGYGSCSKLYILRSDSMTDPREYCADVIVNCYECLFYL